MPTSQLLQQRAESKGRIVVINITTEIAVFLFIKIVSHLIAYYG